MAAVILIGAVLIAIFQVGLGGSGTSVNPVSLSQETDNIEIVKMTPEGLKEKKEIVIVPTQVIEVTFNKKLENAPETKIMTEPLAEVRIELSDDKKTARITPVKPFSLGQGYTLFIKGSTKFEGGKTLGSDADFHFSVINYRGV